jgi:hypothetical protein
MKRLFARFLLAAGLMLLSVASYGQTIIGSVPYTISNPGNYVLNTDLPYAGTGTAITVNSNNVTIDFQGYQLKSSAPSSGVTITGIALTNVNNVTIKNGRLSAFVVGINIQGGIGHVVEKMRILSTYSPNENGPYGITITGGSACQIDNNYFNNLLTAINDSNICDEISGNLIFDSTSINNSCGIQVGGNSYLEGNFVYNCVLGIFCLSESVAKLRSNTTEGCSFPFIGGTLITDDNN